MGYLALGALLLAVAVPVSFCDRVRSFLETHHLRPARFLFAGRVL